jgi:hypothetical protein
MNDRHHQGRDGAMDKIVLGRTLRAIAR